MKTQYQVTAYSTMRGEWVYLESYDLKDEAIRAVEQASPGTYKIEEVLIIN